ncbi:hypothetical protein ACH5RR_033657 [Cinchona calisaya]|uniref:Nuclease HARBI1 n=1 Tax=Cinchona calisaya TaxID=153742 RepID=A0ABD2YAV6_9GENT
MDSNRDDETAMIIGAVTSNLAAGYAVLETYRTPIVIPRPPNINRDQARENYTDSILTQMDVVLACCIVHNHIMGIAPNDRFMQEVIQDQQSQTPIVLHEEESQTQQGQTQCQSLQGQTQSQTQSDRRVENREWERKKDAIAHAMYADYLWRRKNR